MPCNARRWYIVTSCETLLMWKMPSNSTKDMMSEIYELISMLNTVVVLGAEGLFAEGLGAEGLGAEGLVITWDGTMNSTASILNTRNPKTNPT